MSEIIKNPDFVVVGIPDGGKEWWISGWASDSRTGDIFVPAEAGWFHYISKLLLISGASVNLLITIYAGDKILIGPIPMNQYGGQFEIDFGDNKGIMASASAPFIIETNNTANIAVIARGKTT